MKTKHTPFIVWTKKEVFHFCVNNGYGQPKFSGKNKTMYVNSVKSIWGSKILTEIADRRLKYKTVFI